MLGVGGRNLGGLNGGKGRQAERSVDFAPSPSATSGSSSFLQGQLAYPARYSSSRPLFRAACQGTGTQSGRLRDAAPRQTAASAPLPLPLAAPRDSS